MTPKEKFQKTFNFKFSLPEPSRKAMIGWMLAAFTAYSGYNLHLHQATNDKQDKVIQSADTSKNIHTLINCRIDTILIFQMALQDDFRMFENKNDQIMARCNKNHIMDSTDINDIANAQMSLTKTFNMFQQGLRPR